MLENTLHKFMFHLHYSQNLPPFLLTWKKLWPIKFHCHFSPQSYFQKFEIVLKNLFRIFCVSWLKLKSVVLIVYVTCALNDHQPPWSHIFCPTMTYKTIKVLLTCNWKCLKLYVQVIHCVININVLMITKTMSSLLLLINSDLDL